MLHGDLVLPTPESCAGWTSTLDRHGDTVTVTAQEWRTQALLLGLDGALPASKHAWLAPILQCVASGRTKELAADMQQLADRWAATGRLLRYPMVTEEEELCVASAEEHWCVPERLEAFALSERGAGLWPEGALPRSEVSRERLDTV